MRRALERAREIGNRRAEALCQHALGAVMNLLGEWTESRAALERSLVLSRSLGSIFGEILGLHRLALLDTEQLRFDEAHLRLLDAVALVQQSDSALVRMHSRTRVYATLARSRLEAGDLSLAADYLAQGLAAQREVGECASCDVLLYPSAVPIYIALGDLSQAEQAQHKAEQAAVAFRSRSWVATARSLGGLVSAARGQWAQAAEQFEDALDMFEELGQVCDVARTLAALADAVDHLGPAGSGRDVVALRERSILLFAGLGVPRTALTQERR